MGRHSDELYVADEPDEFMLDFPTRARLRTRWALAATLCALLGAAVCAVLLIPPELVWGRATPQGWLDGFGKKCRDWDPTNPTTDVECDAAPRLREVQTALRQHGGDFPEDVTRRLHKLVACTLGLMRCPDQPLVLGLLRPLEAGSEEAQWREDVVAALEAQHFIYVPLSGPAHLQRLARLLPSHLHSVLMDEVTAVECIQNPRCVQPADFVPSPRADQAHPSTEELGDDVGVLPVWRILVASWYGARRADTPWPGGEATHPWGPEMVSEDLSHPWAFNPLGRRWIVSPWAYPDHAFVPPSIQTRCSARVDAVEVLPELGAENDRNVLVLGDASDPAAQAADWEAVYAGVLERGYNVTFVSAGDAGVPARYAHTLPQSVEAPDLLGRADALLALGGYLSTAPLLAVCRGTPVVTPRFQADLMHLRPAGWTAFNSAIFQHGPVAGIPPPHAHTYLADSADQLADALVAALNADFKSYLPREYNAAGQQERIRAWMRYPFEREYKRLRRLNRKKPFQVPVLAQQLRDRCWEMGWCKPGPYDA